MLLHTTIHYNFFVANHWLERVTRLSAQKWSQNIPNFELFLVFWYRIEIWNISYAVDWIQMTPRAQHRRTTEYLVVSLDTEFNVTEAIFTSPVCAFSTCQTVTVKCRMSKALSSARAWLLFHQVFCLDLTAAGSLRKASHPWSSAEINRDQTERFSSYRATR